MFTRYNFKTFVNILKIFIVFLVISFTLNLNSQVINKFGLKGGLSLSKLTLSDYSPGIFNYEPKGNFRLLNVDLGIFTELFDSRYFCLSTELHYCIKGEESFRDFKVIQPNIQYNEFNYKSINDRFEYISFQLLPRWKFMVNTQDRMYVFGGPKFDLRINNSNSLNNEEIKFKNGGIESGIILGIGNEIWELFYIELKYEYSFSNVYSINYDNIKVTRKNSSFDFLIGLSLKKLLKINL